MNPNGIQVNFWQYYLGIDDQTYFHFFKVSRTSFNEVLKINLSHVDKIIMQYDIYDLILSEKFRKRPGMFIGDLSPNNLQVFLSGYQTAMVDMGVVDTSSPQFQEFHDWIANRFGFIESTAGWPNMILAITLGQHPVEIDWEGYDRNVARQQLIEATHRCFELIEEFHAG